VKREQLLPEESAAELPPILEQLTIGQRKILTDHSALYNRLPGDFKIRLESLMHIFLRKVTFEVDGFSEVTEEMRICVAAEACILILNLGYDSYSQLRRVIISKDVLKRDGKEWAGWAGRHEVTMHWDACLDGMYWGSDNHNVILHEFAHVLDQADDAEAQSIPVAVDSVAERRKWEEVIAREYPKIQAAQAWLSLKHTIDKYALTSNAEFFSCATESFFERSRELQIQHSEIYELFKDYYGLDPVQWEKAKSRRDSQLTFIKTFGPLTFVALVTGVVFLLGMSGIIPMAGIFCGFVPFAFLILGIVYWYLLGPKGDLR
tara:strand:+ start:247 stop:1203 length:957 start_codon:yes stop_codon:yes gene_type:complete